MPGVPTPCATVERRLAAVPRETEGVRSTAGRHHLMRTEIHGHDESPDGLAAEAKAAVYAWFSPLARSVGIDLSTAERILIAGALGQHVDVEKAIQIGLLPDLPGETTKFAGNTSILGAYLALLSRGSRVSIEGLADRMTYLELGADNTFHDEWMSAPFSPHARTTKLPPVMDLLKDEQ